MLKKSKKNVAVEADKLETLNEIDVAKALREHGIEFHQFTKPNRTIIPFGIRHVDQDILGTGGVVSGVFTNIWGPKGSGKSALIYTLIASAQKVKPNHIVALYDSEYSYNEIFAMMAGVDPTRLHVIQNNSAVAVLPELEKFARSGACSLIVLDSVANLITKAQEESQKIPGDFAREIKAWMLRFVKYIHATDTAGVGTNQVTEVIGQMFGDNKDYPGGQAYKHNTQMSIRLSFFEWVGEDGKKVVPGEDTAGMRIKINVDKNKFAPLRKTDESNHPIIWWENHAEKHIAVSLIDDGIRAGFVQPSGHWYTLIDPATGAQIDKYNGRKNFEAALVNDDEGIRQRVEEWLWSGITANVPPQPTEES